MSKRISQGNIYHQNKCVPQSGSRRYAHEPVLHRNRVNPQRNSHVLFSKQNSMDNKINSKYIYPNYIQDLNIPYYPYSAPCQTLEPTPSAWPYTWNHHNFCNMGGNTHPGILSHCHMNQPYQNFEPRYPYSSQTPYYYYQTPYMNPYPANIHSASSEMVQQRIPLSNQHNLMPVTQSQHENDYKREKQRLDEQRRRDNISILFDIIKTTLPVELCDQMKTKSDTLEISRNYLIGRKAERTSKCLFAKNLKDILTERCQKLLN